MIVVCKMPQCPFWDNRGFCGKGVMKVDENGMCSVLWKRGQQRELQLPVNEENYPKKLIKIVEAEEYEKEDAAVETSPKDLINGNAAIEE